VEEKEFAHYESNHCIYFRKYDDGDILYLSLYMDEILVASSNMKRIVEVKEMGVSRLKCQKLCTTITLIPKVSAG